MPEAFRIQAVSFDNLVKKISKVVPTEGMEFVGDFEDAGIYEVEAGRIIKFHKQGSRPRIHIAVLAGPELPITSNRPTGLSAKDPNVYKIIKPLGGGW